MEKTRDAPTTKRNVGKTRSVAVKPFQSAWRIWVHAPSPPGLFTMIMKAMVRPRRTSSDSRRLGAETIAGPVMGRRLSLNRECTYATRAGLTSPRWKTLSAAFLPESCQRAGLDDL